MNHVSNNSYFYSVCPSLVSTLVWWANSVVRKFTSTVEATPFFIANCCFIAEKNSWIRVLQIFRTNVLYTLSIAFSLQVVISEGSLEFNVSRNISRNCFWLFIFSCASYRGVNNYTHMHSNFLTFIKLSPCCSPPTLTTSFTVVSISRNNGKKAGSGKYMYPRSRYLR